MDSLRQKFKNNKAKIGYVVAGYPSLDYTKELLLNLNDSCLDILELGIPYSDPLADGAIIAKASFSAAQNNIKANDIFKMLKEIPKPKAELVFLVYYNIIHAYGVDEFIQNSKQAGISGFIIPDLPFEEAASLKDKAGKAGISLIPLISVTSKNRVEFLKDYENGFVYLVGAIGVSGSQKASKDRLKQTKEEISRISDLPVAVGFGIKTKDDVKEVHSYADAAIIGTAIVEQSSSLNPTQLIKKINELFGVH